MRNITVGTILEITKGILLSGEVDTEVNDICTNSREIKENDLFVPLVGEKTDGHNYISMAMKIGAATLTAQPITEYEPGRAYIQVPDTMKALQEIGSYIRNGYHHKIIGVTGSVGKTTTREMITAALSANKKVYHTEGNMNSQIGVPITLSRMADYPSELAVLELGISEEGNMDVLAELVKPDIAVVTMIGVAHIEFLKTQENIRKEKLKIASRMDENGVLFLNGDDKLLAEMRGKKDISVFYYGTEDWCDYRAENIRIENEMTVYDFCHGDIRLPVKLSALGNHNVLNSVAAIAVSDYLGLDTVKAAGKFEHFEGLRQKIIKTEKGYTIIDDTYNASPDSMKAGINTLRDTKCTGRRIAVLADMLELGENSRQYHYEIGEYLLASPTDELIAIGEMAGEIARGAEKSAKITVNRFDNNATAAEYIKGILKPGDVILLKGSNGMHLGEIIKEIDR